MSISPIPLSSLKKEKKHGNNFSYQLYECSYLVRVKRFKKDEGEQTDTQSNVEILMSSFHEANNRILVVLVCSNSSLLLCLKEESNQSVVKQLNWFKNPSKQISALCIDPLRGAWILCACTDSSLYLIPALAQLKESAKIINASPTWSQTDLSRIPFSKPLKGIPTSVVWWHTLDDRNVGIIGTKAGELIFLDISQHQEISRTVIKEKIERLELLQDINDRVTQLLIFTAKKWTLQLLLEQPSLSSEFNPPSSLTQAFDMGYDMVADCNVESILINDNENREEMQVSNRLEVLPQEFRYSIHHLDESIVIGKHDVKFHALEVFSDIKRVPEYVYHLPINCQHVLLDENLIFVATVTENQSTLTVLSRQFSATSFGRQGLKKPDPLRRTDIQSFKLLPGETILNCYKLRFKRPDSWNEFFPHNKGYSETCDLSSFIIVTKDGILEVRPQISPEYYYTELAIKNNIDVAEKIGLTLYMNIALLCEYIADRLIQEKDIKNAVKFYNLSKCAAVKRSTKLVEFSSVTDGLVYIKQVLKKQPTNLSSKDRKQLSNMAILCYIEQVLESQKCGTFSKNLADSFKSFICDNFDYDEQLAMDLLVSYGMIDNLFKVAKTRGKIDDALQKLTSRGLFLLTQPVQNMLLDRGYADLVCKTCNGIFIKHMQPEDTAKFLLAQPDITKSFISTLSKLLMKLEEITLLQIARVFDPSRQFIKPILEKCDPSKRKRAGSGLSLSSMTSSTTVEDPTVPSTSEIIVMFLKTIIALNAKRNKSALPDLKLISRHISGQSSWNGSLYMRSDSLGSNELLVSEMARVKVACGRHHTAFVTDDKELYTWGRASCGRLGHGDLIDERATCQPMRVESLHMLGIQVQSVSCGAMHTIALCQEGVFAWGSNRYGQLGVGDRRKRSRPVLLTSLGSKQINSIVCGQYHSLAVTTDYKAFSWGWGVHGQLGLESNENQVIPQPITLLSTHRIIQVAAGYGHSAVLTSRGQVFTFGAGLYGQLGIGVNTKRTTPQLVASLNTDNIYLIACGAFETLAISDEQTIFCWGRNYHQFHICGKAESASYGRQMASSTTDISHRYYPEDLPFKLQQPINQLICGNWHYMALTSMNYVYTWGCNDCGQLGHYNKINQVAPRLVKTLSRRTVTGIAAGSEFSVAVDSEDQVLAWGRADGGLIGIENETLPSSPAARRSTFSVLAPAPVPGLPIHFDQVSIDSMQSTKREFMFDENYNLPDLSSVGQDQAPYSCEAVLLSLFKLDGLYNTEIIAQYARYLKQWFVLSFCFELQEQWDKAFEYRFKYIKNYFHKSSEFDGHTYEEKMFLVVADLLNKFEDHLPEDLEGDCNLGNLVAMVQCLVKIFDYWILEQFALPRLEDILKKHLESLCPLFAIVFFGFLANPINSTTPTLRFALYPVSKQHVIARKFTNVFFLDLLSQISIQMDSGSNWYNFMSLVETSADKVSNKVAVEESALSRDEMFKEIIEHKRKILNIKPYISLSNAVAATLSAASLAHKVEESETDQLGMNSSTNSQLETNSSIINTGRLNLNRTASQPDSTVFSCSHNLPRYYMLETVIPEFQSRMSELPEPLPFTGKVIGRFYTQSEYRIPLSCPYCIYNNLRNQQMHILRETGADLTNNRSTLWEI